MSKRTEQRGQGSLSPNTAALHGHMNLGTAKWVWNRNRKENPRMGCEEMWVHFRGPLSCTASPLRLAQTQTLRESWKRLFCFWSITVPISSSHVSSCSEVQSLNSVILLLNGKKQHSNTAKINILCQQSHKESHYFSSKNVRERSWGLFAFVQWLHSCASPNMQVKEKQSKATSFFHEEKSFPSRAEASSYCFVFSQMAWEAHYPGVRHTFPNGRENRQGRWSIKKGGDAPNFTCIRHRGQRNRFPLVLLSVLFSSCPSLPAPAPDVYLWEKNRLRNRWQYF